MEQHLFLLQLFSFSYAHIFTFVSQNKSYFINQSRLTETWKWHILWQSDSILCMNGHCKALFSEKRFCSTLRTRCSAKALKTNIKYIGKTLFITTFSLQELNSFIWSFAPTQGCILAVPRRSPYSKKKQWKGKYIKIECMLSFHNILRRHTAGSDWLSPWNIYWYKSREIWV